MAFTDSPTTNPAGTPSNDAPADATRRSVRTVVPSIETLEGAGFIVHRPFPVGDLDQVDPFLLLDHMGPVDYAPGEAVGPRTTRTAGSRPSATSSKASSSTRTRPATTA